MKKQWLSFLCAMTVASSVSLAQVPSYVEVSPDLGLAVQVAIPGQGDYDLYDTGLGVELQFRDWVNYPWGYLLAIGYGEWTSDSNAKKPGSNLYDFDGNLQIVPFGGSVLYQVFNDESLALTLDAGVRYLALDSKITASNYSFGSPEERTTLSIDDGMVFRVGANLEYTASQDFIWTLGVSFQDDINRGSTTFDGGEARDNIMETFAFEAALRMPL